MSQSAGSIFTWPFPLSRTEREIRNSRVPDAVFDVGRRGITGWYELMRSNYGIGVSKGIYSIAALFMLQVVAQAVSFFHLQYTIIDIIIFLAKVAIPAWLLLNSLWHLRVAEAYAKAWKALEKQGVQWQLENGTRFRLVFMRRDGSYKIDDALRQQRVDDEISAVTNIDASITSSVKKIIYTITKAIILYVGCKVAIEYINGRLNWPFLASVNIPCFLAFWSILNNLPKPLVQFIGDIQWKHFYKSGYQYMPNAKVLDQFEKPLTRETVQQQNAAGDAGFLKPHDASRGLSS
jgi:hypothetical protein